ncbi:reverse transcriptase domain-containing protein [Tanacetum coccineum]
MSTNGQTPLSQPTSVVRNTLGKEPVSQDPGRPISDEALREYCDRNYHQILPIIAEKASHHSESGTPIKRRGLKERLGPRYVLSRSESPELRRGRSESPKKKGPERKVVFKRLEKGNSCDTENYHQSSRSRATKSAFERRYNKKASSRRKEELSKSEGRGVVCRFRLPREIISDNVKQFQDDPFKDWCEKLCIRQHFTSVKHPQTNGLVERANRSLGEGIKARLDSRSKNWMEELPHVLFKLGDLVYRNNDASRAEDTGKLGPKWEGPYQVTEALGKEAYKL